MADSPTNGTPSEAVRPRTPDGDVLDELRSLLVGPEQTQLRQLQHRLDTLKPRAADV